MFFVSILDVDLLSSLPLWFQVVLTLFLDILSVQQLYLFIYHWSRHLRQCTAHLFMYYHPITFFSSGPQQSALSSVTFPPGSSLFKPLSNPHHGRVSTLFEAEIEVWLSNEAWKVGILYMQPSPIVQIKTLTPDMKTYDFNLSGSAQNNLIIVIIGQAVLWVVLTSCRSLFWHLIGQ